MNLGSTPGHNEEKKASEKAGSKIGKDDSRKCEEGEGYEQLGRAAGMGGCRENAPAESEGAVRSGVKSEFSPGTDKHQAGR